MEYLASILAQNAPTMVMIAWVYQRLTERDSSIVERLVAIETIVNRRLRK